MSRILILHASVGTGHRSAALALADAFNRKNTVEARVEDTLDYGNPLFRQAYAGAYIDLTNRAPLLWELFYQNTDMADPDLLDLTNRLRSIVERLGVTDVRRLVKQFQPAAIVCTHFLPVDLLLRLKDRGELPQPVYCVVTDFAAHSFWIDPSIDGYFVASTQTRDLMVARGVPQQNIYVTGIPVKLEVAEPKQSAAIRAKRGIAPEQPLITLFGGGVQVERVRHIVKGLLASPQRGTLAVVSGRNEALNSALRNLTDGPTMRLQLLGTIDYVDDLIAASDVVITKPGGLIVSEVLGRGTPLALIEHIPGQEEWNADYVVGMGAGVQIRMVEATPWVVQQLLANPEWLAMLRKGAHEAGKPRAAQEIAERVLEDLRLGRHA